MEAKRLTRGAGILMAITSLPSDYGIGTLGDAAFNFVDLLVDLNKDTGRYFQLVQPVLETVRISQYQHLQEIRI